MKIDQITNLATKKEGNKSQAKRGDVAEVIGVVSDLFYKHKKEFTMRKLIKTLVQNGERRAKAGKCSL